MDRLTRTFNRNADVRDRVPTPGIDVPLIVPEAIFEDCRRASPRLWIEASKPLPVK